MENIKNIEFIGKCLFIKINRKNILVIGDLHFGYEQVMRESGILVPSKIYNEMIRDFDEIFNEIEKRKEKIDEIVLLGDVKHQFGKILKDEWNDVVRFIDYLSKKINEGKIIILKGNHDVILEPITKKRNIEVDDFYIIDEFCFMHGDKEYKESEEKKIKYWIIGHAHPAIMLREERGIKQEKYKCFLIGEYKWKEVIIVPSFIMSNEGSDPRDYDFKLPWKFDLKEFNVRIIHGIESFDFGKLKNLE